jgi:hypothetical protein
MAWLARLALLVVACALATIAIGWPGIIFVAVAFALIDGRPTVPRDVAGGAASAWAVMAIVIAIRAGAGTVGVIGAGLGVPPLLIPMVAVTFAGALGWSSATVMLLLRNLVAGARQPA